MTTRRSVRLGTRTSKLALWQTNHICTLLRAVWPDLICEIVHFSTQGDKTQAEGKPLPEVGGKGLFTAELEEALRSGEIDLAVHSLKDLPVENAPGLTLGAIPQREDVRDALIARNGWTLATLPAAARVGTSSTRRAAQLRAIRPDLDITSIRGNIDTRIRKVSNGNYDATLLALAGLNRLELGGVISEILGLDVMLPAPGQGALAVQCRQHDPEVLHLVKPLDNLAARAATYAERSFLAALGGGCSAPVAAYAAGADGDFLRLHALVAAPDGSQIIRVAGDGSSALIGQQLAQKALSQGADDILQRARTPTPNDSSDTPFVISAGKISPLSGKRIVITRPPQQAQEMVERLCRLGAQPLVIPLIRIVPTSDWAQIDAAIRQLTSYDWLIFTSANAVELFGERCQQLDALAEFRRAHIAAVGAATAEALRHFAVEASFVPVESNGESIAHEIGDVVGKRILLPQATIARRTLVETLRANGAQVDVALIYDTQPIEPDRGALAELERGVDAILFTSGSTVHSMIAASQTHNLGAILQKTVIACIGPLTAQIAGQHGLPVHVVAEEQSNAGVVQALEGYYRMLTAL